jgi:hypothetical protein
MRKVKLIISLLLISLMILVIPITSRIRKIKERKLNDNPCNTSCLNIELKSRSKGGLYLNYTYKINDKSYEGSYNYSSEDDYGISKDKYIVVYVCNQPKISKLVRKARNQSP